MKIINGNLWESKDEIILVTGNSYINSRGELVMGRGAALELKNKFHHFPYIFGTMIKDHYSHLGEYGVLLIDHRGDNKLYGIFQVKYHFKANADFRLIKRSANKLLYVLDQPQHKGFKCSMNFPGIGFGNLTEEEVLPALQYLDNRITLYKR